MTSAVHNNQCKLLVLDLDINKITLTDLRTYFSSYSSVEWIEPFPELASAIIYFASYHTVDQLIEQSTDFIGSKKVRFRRFRLDSNNWHIDSNTLHVKLATPVHNNYLLDETVLSFCFKNFQSSIIKLDLIQTNQALVSFSNYDCVDQILLIPSHMFIVNGMPLVFERMMEKIKRKSRWDQAPPPLATIPVLSVRDALVHKLINHIEYLSGQIREQSNRTHDEIERLEAEAFILKNENAKLKSKQSLDANKNIERRLTALEDISHRFVNQKEHHYHRRERSSSNENPSKRQRKYRVNDENNHPN